MAKSLLLNILVDVLGNYVEGLSRDNLKVAVWSGTIDLYNLKLKDTALDNLQLPIKVERGYLKKLHLKIPWASLESKPVIVELDGIYLQAGPLDMTNLSPEEAIRTINIKKQRNFEEAENEIMRVVHKKEDLHDTAKKATYVQQLTAKIIDNLEVSITNMHVRYEDTTSIPGSIFSCGFTIDALSLTTTDENWSSRFVNRDINKRKETAIHKLGTMANLGVYWNISSTALGSLSYKEWEDHMHARIFKASSAGQNSSTPPRSPVKQTITLSDGVEPMSYLLAPPNTFSMKVAHREACNEIHPNLDVLMDSTTMPFQVASDQYQQLMLVSQEFREMDQRRTLISHRPSSRPKIGVDGSAREWWRYAFKLLTGKDLNNGYNKMQQLTECIRARRIYVPHIREKLVKREIIDPLLGDAEEDISYSSSHAKEDSEIQKFRDNLPLASLIALHQIAAKEAVVAIMKLRADPALMQQYVDKHAPPSKRSTAPTRGFWGSTTSTTSSSAAVKKSGGSGEGSSGGGGGGFFGFFRSSQPKSPKPVVAEQVISQPKATPPARLSADEQAEDEKLMENLDNMLNKYSSEAAASMDDIFTLRMKVNTSVVCSVLLRRQPVVFMDMRMHSQLEMRKTGTSLIFEVDELSIEDSISVKPIHSHLLSMLDAKQEELSHDSTIEDSIRVPRIQHGDTNESAQASSRPKFCFAFQSGSSQSTLKIQSCPVKIVLNEPCVRGLITCFASPVSRYTLGAPLLYQSMSAISASINLPEQSGVVVDMEIYAPTIIIPEQFDVDRGCLQMDTGKLLVRGEILPKEMNWNMVIRSVNIGMPSSGIMKPSSPGGSGAGGERSSTDSSDEMYLVKPFDVKIVVKMSDLEPADISVGVEITPSIEGQLDALKLVRLLYITEVVQRSLLPLPATIDDSSGSSRRAERDIYDSDDAFPSSIGLSDFTQRHAVDIDYTRVSMRLEIKLHRLAVLLCISANHTAELALSDINLTLLQRAGDMNVLVSAQSLALTDSQRPVEHRAIFWTVEESSNTSTYIEEEGSPSALPLVRVSYRMLNTPLSPLYNGNQNELAVICSTMCCGIDDASTMRYVPFAASLMEHYNAYFVDGNTHSEPVRVDSGGAIEAKRVPQVSHPVAKFGASQMKFSVSRITLNMLHRPETTTTNQRSSDYESAFSTEISDIHVQFVATNDGSEVNAHIASVEVKDVRQSSASFVYRTILMRNAESHVLPDDTAINSKTEGVTRHAEMADKIISVRYANQIDALNSTVEVFLQDVTSYVSLDIILAFVDVALANINAANSMLGAINGEHDITEVVMRRLQSLQAVDSTSASASALRDSIHRDALTNATELRENLSVTVTVVNPRLLLLQNPEDRSTKAIVSDCTINFHFSQEKLTAKEAKRFEVSETFHCALQRAQVFVLGNIEDSSHPHKVIAPTGIDVVAKRLSENGVMLTNSLNVGSEPIACRASLNDVVLANTILARAQLKKNSHDQPVEAHQSKQHDRQYSNPAVKAEDSNSVGRNLTLLTVQLNFATVSVVLLNDYRQQNIPMFRMVLDHLTYHASGAIGCMEGKGTMLASADFYNSQVATWEPVLEPWSPDIVLRRDDTGNELSVVSEGLLQLNISGAVCNGIYTCIALISKIGQEGVSRDRRKVHPLVIRNYLGTPLELLDGHNNENIAMLIDNEPFDIPAKETPTSKKGRKESSFKQQLFPDLFELRLLDETVGNRAPITQIPVRGSRARLYHFLPFHTGNPSAVKNNMQSEPIIEEVFENQRYYPMKFSWGEPWTQMNDPNSWTNSRGQRSRDTSGIIPPAGWEWVDAKWKIDVGKVGSQTDAEGWFYNSAFGNFSASMKHRRAQQPLDVVRRRRWIRTRALKRAAPSEEAGEEDLRPIPVFWEIIARSDEAKEILITSGVEFHNNAPCAVEVEMLDARGDGFEGLTPFPVEANSILHLPYSAITCSQFRVRPRESGFSWSQNMTSKLKAEEANGAAQNAFLKAACFKENFGAYHFIVHLQQKDKRVTMTCSGCSLILNHLPCELSVVCAAKGAGVDSAVLAAGALLSITRVSMEDNTELSFSIGEFASIRPVKVSALTSGKKAVVWFKNREHSANKEKEPDLMSITLQPTLSIAGVLEILVYSEYLLIDQSDQAIVVRSDTSELSAPAGTHTGSKSDFVIRRTSPREDRIVRKPIVKQIQQLNNISMETCWSQGVAGVTMFQSGGDNLISIGVNGGSGLLKDISLDTLTAERTPIEVIDQKLQTAYNLAVTLTPLPGSLRTTRLLRVVPGYTIINCLEESIDFLHPTDHSRDPYKGFTVDANSASTWHRPLMQPGTAMRLRSASTSPSIGWIDINDIGSSLLLLPRNDSEAKKHSSHIVAHVEVKFSEPDEASYITVVIWRAKIKKISDSRVDNSTAMLSIKNETGYLISVQQDGVTKLKHDINPVMAKRCELLLQSGDWKSYGWLDGTLGSSLEVTASNNSGKSLSCVVNTLVVGSPQVMGNAISLEVRTIGNGKVLFITMVDKGKAEKVVKSDKESNNLAVDRSSDLVLRLKLQSLGVSLIAEAPNRRELFSTFVESVDVSIRKAHETLEGNSMTSFDLRVKDIHIDNFSDGAIYPVLLNSINSDERLQAEKQRRRASSGSGANNDAGGSQRIGEAEQEYRPFLRFSTMWERPRGQNAVVVKYLAVRLLELKVALDTSTIFIYFLDLHRDLIQEPVFIDGSDLRGVQYYLDDFNGQVLDTQLHHVNAQDVVPSSALSRARAHKYYFEALIVHPIKITATFTPTSLPASRNSSALVQLGDHSKLRLLPRVAAVEDFALKVNSFIVDHAMESTRTMQQRILTKILQDLRSEMVQVAGNLVGSMALLGKPAGLYKNIGNGVSDFFYEPYMGIMESPQAFIFGIGKGTGALLSGVASGVLGSAASLVGTASGGVSTITEGVVNLSGDEKYMRRREEKMRAAKASQGGMFSGLKAGGESIFTGVTSGISGLVTKPYEEGKKSGALGVVKGMGMGILGVATKPVMGVTDGLSSIATGFSQQIQDPLKVVSHIRPQRALDRVEDHNDGLATVVKFDLFSAEAQNYVRLRAVLKSYNDRYLASCTLGFPRSGPRAADAPFGIALSEKYILELTLSMHKSWKITWSQLSHVALVMNDGSGAVDFISYSGAIGATSGRSAISGTSTDGESRRIHCASGVAAVRLYSVLERFAHRMGNQSAVVPLSDLLALSASSGGRSDSAGAKACTKAAAGDSDSADSSPRETSSGNSSQQQTRQTSVVGSYKFGSINARDHCTETRSAKQIFEGTKCRLDKISPSLLQDIGGADRYALQLDDTFWRLICEWRQAHNVVFNPSRCAACLVINNTPHHIQLTEFELKEGKDYKVFGAGGGYDPDSRSLGASGGAVVIFAYGYIPTLTDLAHVKLQIFSSAFSAVISTRRNRTDISNRNGFHAGYVEKVQGEYWSKSVIVINS